MDVRSLMNAAWFGPLLEEVRRELERLAAKDTNLRPAQEQELHEIERKTKGWAESLAKTDLSPAVRVAVEAEWEKALARKGELKFLMAEQDQRLEKIEVLLDPEQVGKRLQRLADVLVGTNPTLGNLELSLHVAEIACYSDSHVVMRTCKLGALAGVTDLLSQAACNVPEPSEDGQETARIDPRRRNRLRTDGDLINGDDQEAVADFAANPHRFAGLPKNWFWEDQFQVPQIMNWSDAHADEVERVQQETGKSVAQLAEHFRKSKPTIRRALKLARERRERSADTNPGHE